MNESTFSTPPANAAEVNPIESLQEGTVSLDFIQQEPSQDYSVLIAQAEVSTAAAFTGNRQALRTNYSEMWTKYVYETSMLGKPDPVVKVELDQALPGSVICDLGGRSLMSVLAASRSAGLFINVEKYPTGIEDKVPLDSTAGELTICDFKDEITGVELLPGEHKSVSVQADMLDFVSRLKDGSVNISMNGIDMDVIGVEGYHEAVAKEVMRVLKSEGIAFGNNAESLQMIKGWIEADPVIAEQFRIAYAKGNVIVIRRK